MMMSLGLTLWCGSLRLREECYLGGCSESRDQSNLRPITGHLPESILSPVSHLSLISRDCLSVVRSPGSRNTGL